MRTELLVPYAPYGKGQTAKVCERQIMDVSRKKQQRRRAHSEIAKTHLAPSEETEEPGRVSSQDFVTASALQNATDPVGGSCMHIQRFEHQHRCDGEPAHINNYQKCGRHTVIETAADIQICHNHSY